MRHIMFVLDMKRYIYDWESTLHQKSSLENQLIFI